MNGYKSVIRFPSFWRMPESSYFNEVDTGLRRHNGLIRVPPG